MCYYDVYLQKKPTLVFKPVTMCHTYGDRVLKGHVDLGLLQEHIAMTCTPQHALERRDAFPMNDASDEPGW